MPDVTLVVMPYMAIERASIAAGVLKAGLAAHDVDAVVCYANLRFAEEFGFGLYHIISNTPAEGLLGEWTFSGAAFPDFVADHTKYLDLVLESGYGPMLAQQMAPGADVRERLFEMRNATTAFVDRLAREIVLSGSRIVGCSSVFQQQCASLALLRRVKDLDPSIVTVLGGANCEGVMGQTVVDQFEWVDYAFSGEADNLFPEFCTRILAEPAGADHPSKLQFPAPILRRKKSVIPLLSVNAPKSPRGVINDMDEVPMPDYSDYFEQLDDCEAGAAIFPGLPVELSRGCWWGEKHHCTFCGLNGYGMEYRSKSTERALRELSDLSDRHGCSRFFVVDNILSMNHLKTLLPVLAEDKTDYSFFFETKANLSRTQVKSLSDAGARWIQAGVESLQTDVLKLLDKGTTAMQNVQLLKWAREYGVSIQWNVLWQVPGEKDEWYAALADWLPSISHLQGPSSLTGVRFDRFSPYYQRPQDFGINLEPFPAYSFIYPLAPELIKDIAYYFWDENANEGVAPWVDPEHSARDQFAQLIDKWSLTWMDVFLPIERKDDSRFPVLCIDEEGPEYMRLRDTRPRTAASEWELHGLEVQVYRACDRAMSRQRLSSTLEREHGVKACADQLTQLIDSLVERRIMLALDGKLLSLATPSVCRPYQSALQFPGGLNRGVQMTELGA